MGYRYLSEAVLLLHLGFILFVVFGALLVALHRGLMPVHLLAVAWGVAIELTGAVCPLTYLEIHFRQLAGEAGYDGSFVEHYLLPLIYPAGLGASAQYALAAAVLIVNIGLYGWLLSRRLRR
jgi:hypothetical protein